MRISDWSSDVCSSDLNLAGVAYDPAQVVAFFDNSYTNASSQRVRGVDLDLRYVVPAGDGMWSFNAGASWITDSQRRIVDGTPEFDTAGVVNYPPKFKGRLGASWRSEERRVGKECVSTCRSRW